MAQVALVTDKGCLSGSGLAEGTTGQVLAQGWMVQGLILVR